MAPQFLATPDAEALRLDADVPYWTPEGWKVGERAIHPEQGPSSYAVLDAMLSAAVDRGRFPALRTVVVAGHSAGGQYVHRYIAANRVHDALRSTGIDVRYVVSNPSSYLYFDDRRLTDGGALAANARETCPGFNRYRYGLEQPNEYVAASLAGLGTGSEAAAAFARRYASREVAYLLGEADSDPNGQSLDRSCAAAAQGTTRLERGRRFFRYLELLLGRAALAAQSLHVVPDIGHDHKGMFMSACGLSLLFGDGRCHRS